MSLGLYDWFYGIAQFSAGFLSIVAVFLSLWVLHTAWNHKHLVAWRYLLAGIILFGVEEVLGALVTFGVIAPTFLTHVIPSFIMIFLIVALVQEIISNHFGNQTKKRRKRK